MEKHIITLEEYELMCEKLHSLENENSKLKGYIEGIEKQLSLAVVVGQSEQLFCRNCKYDVPIKNSEVILCMDCRKMDKFKAK